MDNFNAKLVQKEYEENYKKIRKRKVEDQKEFIIGCIKEACKEGN